MVVAVIAGAAILFPSLATLFRLVLRGRLDHAPPDGASPAEAEERPVEARRPSLLLRSAVGLLIVGFGLVNVAGSELAHGIGALFFAGFVALAARALLPPPGAQRSSEPSRTH